METKILKHFIPWGWATWSKNWREFRKKNKKIILKINNKNPKFINLLQKNLIKKGNYKNYWSLNFMTYNYSKNYHYIFPNNSLVKNIGFDGSGTNSHTTNDLYVIEKNVNRIRYNEVKFYKPDIIKQEKLLKKVFKNFYN